MNATLETFLMTDQPPTCPQCGARVNVEDANGGLAQCNKAGGCGFEYILEDDGETP